MIPLAINTFGTEERKEISRLMIEFKFEINCDNMVETIFDGVGLRLTRLLLKFSFYGLTMSSLNLGFRDLRKLLFFIFYLNCFERKLCFLLWISCNFL